MGRARPVARHSDHDGSHGGMRTRRQSATVRRTAGRRQAGRIVSTAARQPSPFAVVNYVVLVALVVAALIFVKAILISALIGIGIGVILAPALQPLQHVYKIPRAVSAVDRKSTRLNSSH